MLIYKLNSYSMWLDEIRMLQPGLSFNFTPEFFTPAFIELGHPPLYFMLMRSWTLLMGDSDVILRAFSWMCSVIAAASIYRMAVDLTREAFTGAAAALLFSSMGFVAYYTHQTHNYSMLLMTVSILLFFYQRWLRYPKQRTYMIGVIAATLGVLFTHYYGVYAVLAINAHAFLSSLLRWRLLLRWIVMQAIAALTFSPWIVFVVELATGRYGITEDGRAGVPTGLRTRWSTVQVTIEVLLSHLEWVYLGLLMLSLLALVLHPTWRKAYRRWMPHLALLVIFIVGVMGFALLVNLRLRTFLDRRVIYLLPAVALLLAYGMTAWPRYLRWLPVLGVSLLAFTTQWSPTLQGNTFYRQAVEIAAERVEPGETVYLQYSPPFDEPPIRHYAQRLLPPESVYFIESDTDIRNPYKMDDFMQHAWLRDRFWAVRRSEQTLEWLDNIPDERYVVTETVMVGNMAVDRLEAVYAERQPPPDAVANPDKIPLPRQFGGFFQLLDYQLSALEAQPGDNLNVWLNWQAIAPPDKDYAVFVHLVDDADTTIYGSGDSNPSHLGRLTRTSLWPIGKTIYDGYAFQIDPATPPGSYRVQIGIYSRENLLRLPVQGADDESGSAGCP